MNHLYHILPSRAFGGEIELEAEWVQVEGLRPPE